MARARCIPLALACALLAAAAFASADEICVGEPSLCEFGGPAWVIPFPPYEPIDVTTADTLKFSFTPNHNVYILPVRVPARRSASPPLRVPARRSASPRHRWCA